jgi:alpha-ketoglutarate-dependent taurine dioxygenase
MITTERVLDLRSAADPPLVLDHPVGGPRAWTRDTVRPEDWTVSVPPAVLAEIDALVDTIRREPLPVLVLSPDQFELRESATMMARVRHILEAGVGVALVDRLPLDRMSRDEAIAAYWVLDQLVARPVAQKWDGTMLYDVRDTGRAYGYGVRGSWTNVELVFHTDNSFGVAPPDFVGLLCLQPAASGGISRFTSLLSVHNEMLARHPRLLRRLYQPLYYDRQAEHAPDDPKVALTPAFVYDGRRLRARLASSLVRKAHDLLGIPMEAEVEDALAALDEVLADPRFWIEFTIDRGQLQYLDNREVAHFRSQFEDHPDPDRKRHLVRTWLRDRGRRSYNG